MKTQKCLTLLLAITLASFANTSCLGASADSEKDEPRGYVFILAGEWHRQLVEFYIRRLDEELVPPLTEKQKKEIRVLLHHEADQLVEIQMKEYANLEFMIRKTIQMAHESHLKMYDILDENQHYIIPNIVQSRHERLRDRIEVWLDGLWYEVEHEDQD